ncbi:MAG: hypothetical protein U5K69_16305 [Balneolaceae bacterium]|nr:hypothetical protein [Balneolaceae bacterium]
MVISAAGSRVPFRQTLYPTIVQSLPFQLEVLNKNVTFSEPDTTVSVYTYFDEIHSPLFSAYLTEYTVRLPGKIIGALKGDQTDKQPLPKGFETDTVYNVTKSQMNIVNDMRERISISMNEQTGILSLTVQMPDPKAAAEVGQISISLIKEYIANYHDAQGDG